MSTDEWTAHQSFHSWQLLKALSTVPVSIPSTAVSLVKKMSALKNVLKDLKSLDPSNVSEIRVELSVQGTSEVATDLASQYILLDRLPDGVEVAKMIRFWRHISSKNWCSYQHIETLNIFYNLLSSDTGSQQESLVHISSWPPGLHHATACTSGRTS